MLANIVRVSQETLLGKLADINHQVAVVLFTGQDRRSVEIDGEIEQGLLRRNIELFVHFPEEQIDDQVGVKLGFHFSGHVKRSQRRKKPFSIRKAVAIIRRILGAVSVAHSRGLVHRDIKPGNIILQKVKQGFVPKLADFGLMRNFEGAG